MMGVCREQVRILIALKQNAKLRVLSDVLTAVAVVAT